MAKKKMPRGASQKMTARKPSRVPAVKTPESMKSSARSTVSGPSTKGGLDPADAAARKMAAVGELAGAMAENPTKADEYGEAARKPQEGAHAAPRDPSTR